MAHEWDSGANAVRSIKLLYRPIDESVDYPNANFVIYREKNQRWNIWINRYFFIWLNWNEKYIDERETKR